MSNYQAVIDYMNNLTDYNTHNGIQMTVLKENYAECRVDISPNSLNPDGIAHGGLLFSICDYISGFAICGDNRTLVTQSSSFNFLRPGTGAYLRGVGVPVKIGKRTAVADAMVYDDQDRLVAKGTFTFFFTN